jgi:glutamine synthetase
MRVMSKPGIETLRSFLSTHPEIARFELYVVDTNGIWRGKWLDRGSIGKLYEGQVKLPRTTLALDVWGNDIAAIVFADGDSDGVLEPVADGLKPVPWARVATAQVQARMLDLDGSPYPGDPRNVLERTVAALRARALEPVAALELEFHLAPLTSDGFAQSVPAPTTIHGRPTAGAHTYGIEALAAFDSVLSDIESVCRAQSIPTHACIKEASEAQFEINLDHRADALLAADDAVRLKRVVKEVARRHGYAATFMAKPFANQAGNGMHAHVSLEDASGANAFDDGSEHGAPLLGQAVAGLTATMADAMAVFAPGLNSFRRFQPGRHAPMAATWGYENRTTSVRIPMGDRRAIRVEHRVAGADANPYLVLAAVLAGIDHGIAGELKPPPPIVGNAYDTDAPSLPRTWSQAIDRFERAAVFARYFDAEFVRLYCATKRQELETFAAHVTPFEFDTYVSLA